MPNKGERPERLKRQLAVALVVVVRQRKFLPEYYVSSVVTLRSANYLFPQPTNTHSGVLPSSEGCELEVNFPK